MQFLSFLFFMMSHAQVVPGTVSETRVVYAGVYGSGDVYIAFDKVIPNCTTSRIDLPASSPIAKLSLAIAMTAQATGKTITLKPFDCKTMDTTKGSYIYLNP